MDQREFLIGYLRNCGRFAWECAPETCLTVCS